MPESRFRNDADHCERMAAIMLTKAQRESYLELAGHWRRLADDTQAHRQRVDAWSRKTAPSVAAGRPADLRAAVDDQTMAGAD